MEIETLFVNHLGGILNALPEHYMQIFNCDFSYITLK